MRAAATTAALFFSVQRSCNPGYFTYQQQRRANNLFATPPNPFNLHRFLMMPHV
jgi:hypothetical protein